ncbi:MAG: phosphatase PAP2 family protein [Deltaproteobacteria bacterium]|nr:phosphatase PAP2 family protein [Deltaproteobacteria bacterium]
MTERFSSFIAGLFVLAGSAHAHAEVAARTASAAHGGQRSDSGAALRLPETLTPMGLEEVTLAAGFGLGVLATKLFVAPSAGWSVELYFDHAFSKVIAARPENRGSFSDASDVLDKSLASYPFVIDAAGLWALGRIDQGLLLDLLAVDLVAMAASTLVVSAVKSGLSRARPNAELCPEGGFICRSEASRQSFPSGHAATAFTAAGLVCAQHQTFSLYGSSAADSLACASAIGLAGINAVLRVAAQRHHPTDVLGGALIGVAVGYALPRALFMEGADRGDGPELELSFGARGGLASLGGLAGAGGGAEASIRWSSRGEALGANARASVGASYGPAARWAEASVDAWLSRGLVGLGLFASGRSLEASGRSESSLVAGPRLVLEVSRQRRTAITLLAGIGAPIGDQGPLALDGALGLDFENHAFVRFSLAAIDLQTGRLATFSSAIGARWAP